MIKPDETTQINPSGGFRLVVPNRTMIDPVNLFPALGSRFTFSQPLVAKIEAIGRARVKVARYASEAKQGNLWESEQSMQALAMTVNASSEIEGEEIQAAMIPLILNEATQPEPGEPIAGELAHRLDVVRNIYSTYLWALTSNPVEMVSKQFILEIHRRMFSGAEHYSEFAGKFKQVEVHVKGALYHVETLQLTRVEDAIDKLCARTNKDFANNKFDKEKPLLTIIAEFLVDFLAIHPFQDGNGRTVRLLSTYLLERIGYQFAPIYPIDTIINERRREYFSALFSAQRNWYSDQEDITAWVEFYVEAVYEQWERAHRIIRRELSKQQNK